MIYPSIGRVVLLNLPEHSVQPVPALITFVHGPECIDVTGFLPDNRGMVQRRMIRLDQYTSHDGRVIVGVGEYAFWMAYQQKAQAASAS